MNRTLTHGTPLLVGVALLGLAAESHGYGGQPAEADPTRRLRLRGGSGIGAGPRQGPVLRRAGRQRRRRPPKPPLLRRNRQPHPEPAITRPEGHHQRSARRSEVRLGAVGDIDGRPGDMPSGAKAAANYTLTPEDMPLHRLVDERDRNSSIVTTTNDRVSSARLFDNKFLEVPEGNEQDDACRKRYPTARSTSGRSPPRGKDLRPARSSRAIPPPPSMRCSCSAISGTRARTTCSTASASSACATSRASDEAADRPGWRRPQADLARDREREPGLASRRPADQPARDVVCRPQLPRHREENGGPPAARAPGCRPDRQHARPVRQASRQRPGVHGLRGPDQEGVQARIWSAAGRWRVVKTGPDSSKLKDDPKGYTQMEQNFSMFWGISIMLYEQTLISDRSEFDTKAGDRGRLPSLRPRISIPARPRCSGGKTRCGFAVASCSSARMAAGFPNPAMEMSATARSATASTSPGSGSSPVQGMLSEAAHLQGAPLASSLT